MTLRQPTPSQSIYRPELGHDGGILFIGHLALDDVGKGAAFYASPLDLESDAHGPWFVESWIGHLRQPNFVD